MQSPLTNADTLFEQLLQDLPPETLQLAREFKAFVRAKKVKTPEQLLRLVLLYCGLDKPLREVAGTFTVLYEPLTDQAVAERLRACGPWVKAMLGQMLPMAVVARLPEGLRFVVIDASSIQAPGAKGTDHRLHISMDLVSLQFIDVLVSDVHTGETLKHFTLGPGDVALTDRGYAQAPGMRDAVKRGAALIVRLNPFSVVLCDATGQPLSLSDALKRWKSVLDVDALRAKARSPLAEVWLHGKLLYALLLERRMRRQLGDSWGRLDQERVVTWWRIWGMLKDEIAPMVTGSLFWQDEAWAACLKVLAERPRRRKLQQLPPEVVAVLYHSDQRQKEGRPIAA